MDTNPMIQGNDTLTDCLNGTLITMNGNEVILQNDMGNRRVDNAFLPPGYEPVGIKEYGGIIYIAAYNPITNKSQIGSFPSPEKRINRDDDPNLGGEFDFDKFFSENNVYIDSNLGINVIRTDSFMIPLTSDTSLRAGDKFVVYGALSSLKNQITNYENTCFAFKSTNIGQEKILIAADYNNLIDPNEYDSGMLDKPTDIVVGRRSGNSNSTTGSRFIVNKKVISPKNKKYTLQLGILNSQNEFVDITKTLVRWKNSNIIEYNDSVSELYRFNDGYFIPDLFSNPNLDETIDDSEFIRNRQAIEANTYSYKLIGPLYLKVNLNHIVRFNYNIYGIFNNYVDVENICYQEGPRNIRSSETAVPKPINNIPDNCIDSVYEKEFIGNGMVRKLRLWVEGYITYNCPDSNYSVSNKINNRIQLDVLESNDENYATYEELDAEYLIDNVSTSQNPIEIYEFFDFIHDSTKLFPENTKISKAIYNPDTNLYTIKVTKEYLIDDPNTETYDYVIGVLASFNDNYNNDDVYLRDLSCKGSINLNLLGSGDVDVSGWRFYNDVEQRVTLLTVAFEAYPELNKRFENLNFNFKDITRLDEEDYEGINYGGGSLYNGRQTYTINWGDDFDARKVYIVEISYDVVNEDGTSREHRILDDYWTEEIQNGTKLKYHKIQRWILTTELFNEFYQSTSGISDFCDLNGVDEDIKTAFENKMYVNLHGEGNVVNKSSHNENFKGGLISKTSNIEYVCNHAYSVTLMINPEINIINEELYPDFIKIDETKKNSISVDEVVVKSVGSTELENSSDLLTNELESNIINTFKNQLVLIKGNETTQNSNIENEEGLLNIHLIHNPNNESVIGGIITYKDIYKGYNTSLVPELYNVFDKLSNILDEVLPQVGYFAGIIVQGDDKGHPNHLVRVGKFSTTNTAQLSSGAKVDCDYVNVATDTNTRNPQFYNFSTLSSKIYQEFNGSLCTPGQMFLYLFTENPSSEGNDNLYNKKGHKDDYYYNDSNNDTWKGGITMLWWRTAENEWATFNKSLSQTEDVKDFILSNIKKDYVYRMYDMFINDGTVQIHAADQDYEYYDEYNIPLTLLINYELEEDNGTPIQVLEGLNIQCGNLKFTQLFGNIESDEITFDLKSSDVFHDTINTFDKDHISDIDLNTGLQIDSLNQKLTPDSIYYYTYNGYNKTEETPSWRPDGVDANNNPIGIFTTRIDNITVDNNTGIETKITTDYMFSGVPELHPLTYNNYYSQYSASREITDGPTTTTSSLTPDKMVKIKRPYFTTDSHNTIDGKNTLVYNKYSISSPEYCYQGAHLRAYTNEFDDDRTILYYNAVNIVSDKSS